MSEPNPVARRRTFAIISHPEPAGGHGLSGTAPAF